MIDPIQPDAQLFDFLDFLEIEKHLTNAKLQRVKNALNTSAHSLDIILTELGLVGEDDLAELYSRFLKCRDLHESMAIDVTKANDIGLPYLSTKSIMPVQNDTDVVLLVMSDPFDIDAITTVEYYLEQDVERVVTSRKKVNELLNILEATSDDAKSDFLDDSSLDVGEFDMERLQDVARQAPIIQLANRLTEAAVDQSATDIHIEPREDAVTIRFRIDGVLQDHEHIPKSMQAGLNTRLKILSGMNISERRLPQDGRIRTSIRGKDIDFRVSSVPSIHGETIVIRILQNSPELLLMDKLGFAPEAEKTLDRILENPNGITLVTGPTGSGKTTTLYSLLNKLNDGRSKIFTVEDPVEYRLEGITQLQVDAAIGLDFAETLRSVLRQDPDTILIGEIRDLETARIAIQAALTGHRVLATLHTNSAVGVINRLRDMGIDNFLLSSTLRCVLSQRLVRKSCGNSNGSEYSGRTVIYEILEVNNDISRAIAKNAGEDEITSLARKAGMISIMDYANKLVDASVTTKTEILRLTKLEASYG